MTGSLDSVTADHIFEVFEHLVTDQGKTIVMVTHDESLTPRFTRSLGIADGELANHAIDTEGTPPLQVLTGTRPSMQHEPAGKRRMK